MIRTDKLRGIISERGMSQSNVAHLIGITPKTFYEKMSKENPMEIFFDLK